MMFFTLSRSSTAFFCFSSASRASFRAASSRSSRSRSSWRTASSPVQHLLGGRRPRAESRALACGRRRSWRSPAPAAPPAPGPGSRRSAKPPGPDGCAPPPAPGPGPAGPRSPPGGRSARRSGRTGCPGGPPAAPAPPEWRAVFSRLCWMLLLSTATADSSSRMVASRPWMAKRSWSAWDLLLPHLDGELLRPAEVGSTACSASSFWRTASLWSASSLIRFTRMRSRASSHTEISAPSARPSGSETSWPSRSAPAGAPPGAPARRSCR